MLSKLIDLEPLECAKMVDLLYINDNEPGITRKRSGKSFCYFDAKGKRIQNKKKIQRIDRLAIPPAYTDVWICADEKGHLQATGRDIKGRKQYIYHSEWTNIRNATKYHRMLLFGKTLPKIRHRVADDLKLAGLPKNKVLAAIVKLLESTLIRVGNIEYAKNNHSYGLTTLRKKHVKVSGDIITFDFTGKSNQDWSIKLYDKKIARILHHCEEIPGQKLFKYLDENNNQHEIASQDVNNYLHEISGLNISAKDFRTWAGTVLTSIYLQEFTVCQSISQAKKNVTQAIKKAAQKLGNTPTICRQCYIHPVIITTYLSGDLLKQFNKMKKSSSRKALKHLSLEENAVLIFLQNNIKTEIS